MIGKASTSASAATASATVHYEDILRDLCGKIEGASYYSGSSSTWFLRGALAKYETDRIGNNTNNNNNNSIGNAANSTTFSPRGLTDVLLEKLLLETEGEKPFQTKDKTETNEEQRSYYLTVAKALAEDSSKYLPAMTASLSGLISANTGMATTMTMTMPAMSIPREFLQVWVTALLEDATEAQLHEELVENLFGIIRKGVLLRDSSHPMALAQQALTCLVQGDSWHSKSKNASPSLLPPPSTQATLRRAAVLMRFLSSRHDFALDASTRISIATRSGAMEWFWEVVKASDYENCPVRYRRHRRDTSRKLLELLLEELSYPVASANTATSTTTTTANATATAAGWEWLQLLEDSERFESLLLSFFQKVLSELLEDWNEHLQAMLPPPTGTTTIRTTKAPLVVGVPQKTNDDLLPMAHQKALGCATLYIQFLARLPPGMGRLSSSLVIAQEASKEAACDCTGTDLLARMLRSSNHPLCGNLTRLRLVRLLLDEFGARCSWSSEDIVETSDSDYLGAHKEWLTLPTIRLPILEECSKDPFLGSCASTEEFLTWCYGEEDSWKARLAKKPLLRTAPKAIPHQAISTGRFSLERVKPPSETNHHLRSLPLALRTKIGDRWGLFGPSNSQDGGSQYNLFPGEHSAVSKDKPPANPYSLFEGGNRTTC